MIISSNEQSIMAQFNKNVETMLLDIGFDNMSLDDKNSLIVILAESEKIPYNNVTDDYILTYHKKKKIEKLNSQCEDAIAYGFVASNGHKYRVNRDDQIDMICQNDILANNEAITKVIWKAEDVDTWIEHTREEWLQMYNEAFEHKQSQLFKYDQLKQQVINAKTHDEILAIKWQM